MFFFRYCSDSEYSLDRIKLESYIEKILPESPTNSEILDEESSNSRPVITNNPSSLSPQEETSPTPSILEPFKNLQEQNPNESIRSWLQRITLMQNEIQKKMNLDNSNRAFSDLLNTSKSSNSTCNSSASNSSPVQKPSRIVKYEDLPYMGEMTLDNSKPRRGRKPKKADICHLIYKNYGTIFPGIPDASKEIIENECNAKKKSSESSSNNNTAETLSQSTFSSKSNVQNKIISSLLEKRLTQETKRNESISESITTKLLKPHKRGVNEQDQDEPLNLCIRDLNQLKIRLLRKHSNTYTSDSTPEIKSEPQSDDEVEFVNETSSLSSQETPDLKIPALSLTEFSPTSTIIEPKNLENGVAPGGYIYWPNAGVFIHPMALQQQLIYYQRMAANNNYTLLSQSPRPTPEISVNSVKPTPELRKLAPKIRPKKSETSEESENQSHETKVKRNASSSSDKTPVKRKRSAIFIPPIPSENQTNPATEVSICKFKFTGGAKPSLQEKKMLSVDSGGNFRYYSGTGDKSMRGYEFFPREALQQQVESAHGSSTGAFLQASGEKIFPPPVDFAGKQAHPDLLLSPDVPTSSLATVPDLSPKHKKRKSRKSIQREKLEQTFKEKGFLIQTQQLESAEGATYCKFRQLRKFTRYLFRSWKDYLPGNVRELQEEEEDGEPDMENVSNGLTPNNLNAPL